MGADLRVLVEAKGKRLPASQFLSSCRGGVKAATLFEPRVELSIGGITWVVGIHNSSSNYSRPERHCHLLFLGCMKDKSSSLSLE